MRSILIIVFTILFSNINFSQDKFITKQGNITFFSKSPAEDIEAKNNQVLSIIDKKTGDIVITILMKSFIFKKSLMQEHFNENYVESDKFPKAIFKGKIDNFEQLDKQTTVTISGDLTIHGITKKVQVKSKIVNSKDKITLLGDFKVVVEDYKIKIPLIVRDNIAEIIKINFDFNYIPYK